MNLQSELQNKVIQRVIAATPYHTHAQRSAVLRGEQIVLSPEQQAKYAIRQAEIDKKRKELIKPTIIIVLLGVVYYFLNKANNKYE